MDDSTHTPRRPSVSCIVPVFNGERYLCDALESIFRQTYQPVEIVVVDDGSTDATPEVVASYTDRVCAVRQANAGPAAARNRGVRVARGELIAFLDADDEWHPEKLARQIARFEARPELEFCVTCVRNFWIPELREEEARFRAHRIAQPQPGYLATTLVARRGVFASIGEFDAALRFGHSTDWFLRAAARGVVSELLPEVLYYRRVHHSNRSRRLSAASRDEYLELLKAHLDRQRAARQPSCPPADPPKKEFDRRP